MQLLAVVRQFVIVFKLAIVLKWAIVVELAIVVRLAIVVGLAVVPELAIVQTLAVVQELAIVVKLAIVLKSDVVLKSVVVAFHLRSWVISVLLCRSARLNVVASVIFHLPDLAFLSCSCLLSTALPGFIFLILNHSHFELSVDRSKALFRLY